MNKSMIKTIKNSIYYLIIAFLLTIIIISAVNPKKLIDIFGFSWYNVVSASMEPVIMTNDHIIAKRVDDVESLKTGEIIIFETYFYHEGSHKKGVVTHYFGYITEEGYIKTYPHKEFGKETSEIIYDKWFDDYMVKKEDVIGKHVETIPTNNASDFITYLFTRPFGLVILVLISSGIGYFVYVIFNEKSKKNNV